MTLTPARSRLLWSLGFSVLTLAVVYGAFAWLYGAFRHSLDDELGYRLMAVASATSAAVNGEVWIRLGRGDPLAVQEVRRDLEEIREVNDLSDIFLFDLQEVTLLDLRGQYPEGEPNAALKFDVIAATTALAGLPAHTRLYEGGGTFLKSGYAPVLGPGGTVIGGVGVEGSAAFFEVLSGVRNTLLAAAGATLVGMILLGIGFGRLLSRQSQLESRLGRSETLATLGQMAAMLAHEIRNPLGIIRGSAETLAERYDLQDDEIYRFIPEEVDRLHHTVSAYLDFARGDEESGTEDLRTAVTRTLELAEGDLERKQISLRVDLDPGSFPVPAGPRLLQQAFLNLVLNARDAMPEGGTLTVTLRRRGDRAVLEFSDTGVGMTEEVRRRAEEPFFTSKDKGSGLGLAVVRRTVDQVEGTLVLASRPGEGTTVTLTFVLETSRGEQA